MFPFRPALLLLAALGGTGEASEPGPVTGFALEGGSEDDRRFAAAALGWKAGDRLDPAALDLGLAAIRATDRFRQVDLRVEDMGASRRAVFTLASWPLVSRWAWKGEIGRAHV